MKKAVLVLVLLLVAGLAIGCRDNADEKSSHEEIAADGHQHKYEGVVTTEPTCEKTGVKTYTCSVCGTSYTEKIDKLDHKYTEKVTKEPTCTDKGEKEFTCSLCGKTYTEKIDVIDHQFEEKITKQPTCKDKGEKAITCKICGKTSTEVIDNAGVAHTYTSTVTKQPTCTEEGERKYTCSICGNTYAEPIAKVAHQYEESISKEATCSEEGTKLLTCKVCSDTKTESIPKKDHQYNESITREATCAQEGEKLFQCAQCGTSYTESIPKTNDHTTRFGTCSRCGTVVTILKDNAVSIQSYFAKGIEQLNKALDKTGEALNSSNYRGAASAITSFGLSAGQFQNAINACGDYPEFAGIKEQLTIIHSAITNTFSGNLTIYGDSRDLATLRTMMDTMIATTPNIQNIQGIMSSWPAF